ncbi:hypothetical protein HPB51_005265 [Rhipicephalus microplus]|uniref:ISXO2-like transposase domain-containing protein n=1 Tax=Rhipicephalus microplus TaxID=6941 RepID=A0A9J6ERU7_RHIMP|nr:hypothetical protein HPB51_005265 [Rhipicephalus microplus]
MATPRIDPSIVEIADIIRYPAAEEAFLREIKLSPAPSLRPAVRPQAAGTTMGRPPTSEYWGICKDLCFNPGEPGCGGKVVTYNRPGKKGSRRTFRCNRCRKKLSQLRGTQALQGRQGQGSFFACQDVLGRPNVKLSRREIIWLTYAMVKGFSSRNTRELTEKEFKLSNTTRTDWRNYIREVALEELRAQPAMGGVGEVVQIDECLLRGRRKANRGRLLTGDSVPPRRRNNYGGVSNKGPWIFGMLHVSTKELRLFQADKRDAATLGSLIAKHISRDDGVQRRVGRVPVHTQFCGCQRNTTKLGLAHRELQEKNFLPNLAAVWQQPPQSLATDLCNAKWNLAAVVTLDFLLHAASGTNAFKSLLFICLYGGGMHTGHRIRLCAALT